MIGKSEVATVLQKNWQSLIKPNKLNIEPGVDSSRIGIIE